MYWKTEQRGSKLPPFEVKIAGISDVKCNRTLILVVFRKIGLLLFLLKQGNGVDAKGKKV